MRKGRLSFCSAARAIPKKYCFFDASNFVASRPISHFLDRKRRGLAAIIIEKEAYEMTTPSRGAMPLRTLGNELAISAIGFGAMGMSEFYGPSDDIASLAVLDEALDLGVTMIDTADLYGRGHNEKLIGRFLSAHKWALSDGRIKIATKCGIERPADEPYRRTINNSRAYIRSCCEASLTRLGVECIDLYYIHRVDQMADIVETMGTLSELVSEGKIARIGLCEVSASTLEKANNAYKVTAIQTEYSLWTRDVEREILPKARELEVGFVAYSPLGRGFLTGRITSTDALAEEDFRRSNPRFQSDNLAHNLSLLKTVETVAARHGATPAQIALAWLLAQDEHIVPIPGTRRSAFLRENVAAVEIELTPEDLQELDGSMTLGQVRGARYTAEGMKGLDA
jgi:aryl-alcohol dehydrogenase-like predicted oxidoreductase